MIKENTLTKTTFVALLAFICCALWGSAFPCIKVGYQLFNIKDTGSQILFAGYRFTLAGIITYIIGYFIHHHHSFPKKDILPQILGLGLVQTTIQYIFFYIGLCNTTGVKSSIINGTGTFISIILAHFFMKSDRLTIKKIIGCILGFLGIITINISSQGMDMSMKFTGEGFIFISAIAYAVSSLLIKNLSKKESTITITAFQFIFGGILLIGFGLALHGKVTGFTLKSSLLLLYLALLSSIAFTLWGILLKYNPIGKIAIYGFMNPICGVILSALILGEQAFTIKNLLSLILVSLGIYVVNKPMKYAKSE